MAVHSGSSSLGGSCLFKGSHLCPLSPTTLCLLRMGNHVKVKIWCRILLSLTDIFSSFKCFVLGFESGCFELKQTADLIYCFFAHCSKMISYSASGPFVFTFTTSFCHKVLQYFMYSHSGEIKFDYCVVQVYFLTSCWHILMGFWALFVFSQMKPGRSESQWKTSRFFHGTRLSLSCTKGRIAE